jgi:protein SCO1/2
VAVASLSLVALGIAGLALPPAGAAQRAQGEPGPAIAATSDTTAPDRAEPLPDDLVGIGITEKLDNRIPIDAAFRDEEGREVRLGDYLGEGRPIILNLMYLSCPMLCGLVSNGLSDAMKQLDWTAGDEFTVLSVSFDASETPALAKLKKLNYVEDLGRPSAAGGWHFLTGDAEPIRRLTEAIGFGFRWNEQRQEFAHAAAIFILTPDGRISRYLYGVQFDPQTLRLSLVEASEGEIGTTRDKILLYCFQYDPSKGRYGPAAQRIMRAGGLLTATVLAILIFSFWRRDRKRAASDT